MNRIIIVDGNSLLFRAYFATSFTGQIMTTKDGIPTNAIYAFSNMMSKIVATLKDKDLLFVSFDTGKKTFRHDALESYKAQRKPIDDALKTQLPIARDLLKAMNIFYYELEGHEGDDIAGTVAKMASKENYNVEIYTSDKDFLQLIDNNIQVKLIKKGLSDIEIMTLETLKEKMSLTPDQIRDYKGLTGDSSDNLKGIPGIGEKTALKLLNEYGTLENIIKACENQSSKLAQKIISGKDEGLLCKQLATIELDVPIPFKLKDLEYVGYDFSELSAFYTKYEFFTLLKKLKPTDKRIIKKNVKNEPTIKNHTKNVVNSFKDIPLPMPFLICDIENKNYANIRLNSFTFSDGKNSYLLKVNGTKLEPDLIAYLEDETIKKSVYDSKSLKLALLKLNVTLKGVDFDLLLATYLLKSSIDNDPRMIFGYYGYNIQEGEETISLFDDNPYFFNMAYALSQIKDNCLKQLESINCLNLYYDIELPLSDLLARMENEGFPIDRETLNLINAKYVKIVNELEQKILSYSADPNLNLSSPKQLADLLYNQLKLPSNKKQSTSIEVLNNLVSYHEIIPLIIEYRKYSKIVSTYSSGLIDYIANDNKIHASFNQALTTTGRLSSSEPNLQNISIRSEEGKEVRKSFFYKEPNLYLLSLDYSQIELRILACLSNCKPLIDAFNENRDIHEETARKIFSIPDDMEVPELERRRAKTVNFGIVYGISDWGLAEQLEITIVEAKKIIDRFNESFPEIHEYFTKIINQSKEDGYSLTLFNRRRYIPELNSDNYQTREFGKRAAMNAPIQGTAADIVKLAMVKTDLRLKENGFKSQIVSSIHDELILKVYEDEKDKILDLVKDTMENIYPFSCPLKVDGHIGKTWYDAK